MKRILISLIALCLVVNRAEAQVTAQELMGAGMPAEQAVLVASVFTGGATVANNTYIKARNAAGSANINLLKVDGSDDTILNADSGDIVTIANNGTGQVSITDGTLEPVTDNDIDLGSASKEFKDLFIDGTITTDALTADGLIYISHSAGGILEGAAAIPADLTTVTGTAPTLISLKNPSADADNIALLSLGAHDLGATVRLLKSRATDGTADTIVQDNDDVGTFSWVGANGTSFSQAAVLKVEVDGTPGASDDMPARMVFSTTPDGSGTPTEAMRITNAQVVQLASTLTSTRTTDLGWAVVAGANTACNTTCTSACVFGVNTAATEADIVACSDATADECLCAGAS